MSAPDPERGLRGVFAATLVLEAIAVLLALLVITRVGEGTGPLGVAIVVALAGALLVAAGLQRRPWGLGLALALQLAVIACWPLTPALGVLGLVFALVWLGLLLMRRGIRRRPGRAGRQGTVRDSQCGLA